MAQASHSDSPRMKRMVSLAKTLKGMHHKADGGSVGEIPKPGQIPPTTNARDMMEDRSVRDSDDRKNLRYSRAVVNSYRDYIKSGN